MKNIAMHGIIFLFILSFSTIGFSASNDIDLTLTFDNSYVTISWEGSDRYNGCNLLYAPYPGANYVGEIDMGRQTSFVIDASNLAFYVAVQPYGENTYSNIEYFDCDEFACNEFRDNGEQNNSSEGINYSMPIKVGNYLKYRVKSGNETYYDTVQITEAGSSYYTEKRTSTSSIVTGYALSKYVFQDNVWKLSRMETYDSGKKTGTTTFSPYNYAVPSTIEVGGRSVQNYTTTNQSISSVNTYQFTNNIRQTLIIEEFETVTVAAGTFETVQIHSTMNVGNSYYSGTVESDTWYAKGIGMVKYFPRQEQYFLVELSSYRFQ